MVLVFIGEDQVVQFLQNEQKLNSFINTTRKETKEIKNRLTFYFTETVIM